jgi:hypothetical protein
MRNRTAFVSPLLNKADGKFSGGISGDDDNVTISHLSLTLDNSSFLARKLQIVQSVFSVPLQQDDFDARTYRLDSRLES